MVQVVGQRIMAVIGSKSLWFILGVVLSQLFAREVADFCAAQGVSLLQGVF